MNTNWRKNKRISKNIFTLFKSKSKHCTQEISYTSSACLPACLLACLNSIFRSFIFRK